MVSEGEPIFGLVGATGLKVQGTSRKTGVWSEFNAVSGQGSLLSATFIALLRWVGLEGGVIVDSDGKSRGRCCMRGGKWYYFSDKKW